MHKLIYQIAILLSVLLFSCTSNNQDDSKTLNQVSEDTINLISPEDYESKATDDTSTVISFDEFNVTLSRLIVIDVYNILNSIQKDTVFLFPELGESIEGQILKVDNLTLDELKIEQRYETSISIQNEGPHCDLMNWKHYTSPWEELQNNNNQTYQCISYQHEDYQKFPTASVNEFKSYVKTNYDKEWYDLISKIKSIYDYPSSVGISKYFIRISGIDKKSKALVSKILIFENPMGC